MIAIIITIAITIVNIIVITSLFMFCKLRVLLQEFYSCEFSESKQAGDDKKQK